MPSHLLHRPNAHVSLLAGLSKKEGLKLRPPTQDQLSTWFNGPYSADIHQPPQSWHAEGFAVMTNAKAGGTCPLADIRKVVRGADGRLKLFLIQCKGTEKDPDSPKEMKQDHAAAVQVVDR